MKKLLILLVVLGAALATVLDPFPSAPKREIQNVLKEAGGIELVGLDPARVREESPDLFGSRKVIQRRSLSAAEQQQVRAAVQADLRYRVFVVGRCFNPRHGLELTTSSGKYQLLLCYECNQMELVSPQGKSSNLVPLGGSSAETLNALLQTR
jgi:hypothetical protein